MADSSVPVKHDDNGRVDGPDSRTGASILQSEILLTTNETARVLRVPAATVENLYRVRQLVGCKLGKHLRFRASDVQAFVTALEGVK